MAILSNIEINGLQKTDPPLISSFVDWQEQLQPAGFDMSVDSIMRPSGLGRVLAPPKINIKVKYDNIHLDQEDGCFYLEPGYYIVRFCEILCFPKDISGIAFPRSTLVKYGATLVTGFWDPGFHGRSHCGLHVLNNDGIVIEREATIMQMTFHRLDVMTEGFKYNYLYRDKDGNIK